MQQVNRPVLRKFSVIAKGSGDLELERPLAFQEQVRRTLGNNPAAISVENIQAILDKPKQLRFSVGPNACRKVLKGAREESIAIRMSATSDTTWGSSIEGFYPFLTRRNRSFTFEPRWPKPANA